MLQNDVLGPYLIELATAEQQARWLPGFTAGEKIAAIAMSEPGAGSDLRGIATHAVRDGDDYVLNGSKTFISTGTQADLVVVAARTSDEARASGAFSLLMVEGDMEGFERGRKLEKVGRHGQDTAELFFNDVSVPVENLVGEEGDRPAQPHAQPRPRAPVRRRRRHRRRPLRAGHHARVRQGPQGVRHADRQLPGQPPRARLARGRHDGRPVAGSTAASRSRSRTTSTTSKRRR